MNPEGIRRAIEILRDVENWQADPLGRENVRREVAKARLILTGVMLSIPTPQRSLDVQKGAE